MKTEKHLGVGGAGAPSQPPERASLSGSGASVPVRVVELTRTCGACPAQWDGLTDDNRQVYVRYRWGYLRVTIGEPNDMAEYAGVDGEQIFGKEHGGEYGGSMSLDELRALTAGVIAWPESEDGAPDEVRP